MSLKGLTFTELMLVIVLIAVMLAVASPRLRSTFVGLEVSSFSKRLVALMRYAQSKAIAEREMIYLVYTETGQLEKQRVFYLAIYDSGKEKLLPVDERYNLSVPSSMDIDTEGRPDNLPKDAISVFIPDSSIQGAQIFVYNEQQKFKITTPLGGIGRIYIEELVE